MKLLYEIFNTYGKSDGEELHAIGLIEDTQEERESLIDEYFYVDEGDVDYTEVLRFIEGKVDSVYVSLDGGDWDEPTGREVVLTTYETKVHQLSVEYQKQLDKINKLFGKSVV